MARGRNRVPLLLSFVAVLFLGISAFLIVFFSSKTDTRSKAAVGDTKPITGAFIMVDTSASPATWASVITEMADTGIDTIVLLAAGYLGKSSNGDYQEITYFDSPENTTDDIMRLANENNMDIYIGLAAYDMNVVQHWVSADKWRLIDYSIRLIDRIQAAAAAQNVPWSRIKGFYLGETGSGNLASLTSNELIYWKDLSLRVKEKAPDKHILISPYVFEGDTYNTIKNVYQNVYSQTAIDIIAPQDSMGTLKVTSYAKSAELFRALSDVTAQNPGKQAWANIETQLQPSINDGNYNPSTITRVSSQIAAAKPYVSKMITWIYQHTMLSNPEFDSIWSWTGQYTPERAAMRKTLRNDYVSFYSNPSVCKALAFYNIPTNSCATTSSLYNITTQAECGKLNPPTCAENLAGFLPGKTTGVCYLTAADCQNANPTPTSTPIPTAIPTPTPIPTSTPTATPTATPTPDPSWAAADIDGNDKVNIIDYTLYMSYWFLNNIEKTDLNGDGKKSAIDYTIFMNGWWAYRNR